MCPRKRMGFNKVSYINIIFVFLIIGYSIAQPIPNFSFQNPTDFRHYTGYCGEERLNPKGQLYFHSGLDIAGPTARVIGGADVHPSAFGAVSRVGWSPSEGIVAEINHGGGWVTKYLHLKDFKDQNKEEIRKNQIVGPSDIIGHVGNTGGFPGMGPHLHFEIIFRGVVVNPLFYLPGPYTCRSRTGCPEEIAGGGCEQFLTNPGGDHPDDTFSVADGTLSTTPGLENAYYRLAVKKGKAVVVNYYYFRNLIEERDSYFENLPEVSIPDQAYLDTLDEKIFQLIESFGSNQEVFWEEHKSVPDVAVLKRGYFDGVGSLLGRLQEPTSDFLIDFSPQDVLSNQAVLLIPSGGLYGLQESIMFKASLDEYVKNGGTLIVFAQQHGYEFSVLPVPQEEDGTYKTITGYGWTEDQSCFTDAAYIDTWHQILAGQSKSTPSLHVDGYFTTYPTNATVLLRRSVNGQPALLMYDYGEGKVILTSMYSDFAFTHNQASSQEIVLVRDMINWAKKPTQLPEVKPSETVSAEVSIINNSTSDASSAKVVIYNPDRSLLVAEQALNFSVPAAQTVTIPVSYPTSPTSPLGIYHIDYVLLDSQGNIIQPQAETDSGRFVVSNPPKSLGQMAQLTFSIQSDSEHYMYGVPVSLTIIAFNSSDVTRTVTAKYEGGSQTLAVPPKGSNSFSYLTRAEVSFNHYGQLWGSFPVEFRFAEDNTFAGWVAKDFRVYYPNANIVVKTEKTTYAKGETVRINTEIKNKLGLEWQAPLKITIEHLGKKVFEELKTGQRGRC